jgi:tripartite-type tricarboxylate transporter receptor subunit TctC
MRTMRQFRIVAALFAASLLAIAPGAAQEPYPSRPITIVVPFGAGGALDLIARVLADGLRPELGQPVIIENKPGGSGSIAMRAVAAAPPDGHTLLLSSESNHILLPLLDPKVNIDVFKEFAPISLSGEFQHVLIVKKEMPAGNVRDLVEYLKRNPGKLSFGSSGVGTMAHIAGEFLSKETQGQMVHVPYRGSPAAMNDLLAGNLDVNIQSMPALRSHLENPRLRILAVLSPQRLKDLPDTPTMAEIGFPDFVLSSWMGMFAPAALPADIRNKLSAAFVKIGQNPDLQARIRQQGIEPVGSDAASFERYVAAEAKKWKAFVERTGVKLQ